jgi:hypothetical protein
MPPTAGRTPGPIAVFSNSYARLPEHFFARLNPTPVAKPHLIKFNDALASELGVNTQGLDPDRLAAMFVGNVTPSGAEPIAMVYANPEEGSCTELSVLGLPNGPQLHHRKTSPGCFLPAQGLVPPSRVSGSLRLD